LVVAPSKFESEDDDQFFSNFSRDSRSTKSRIEPVLLTPERCNDRAHLARPRFNPLRHSKRPIRSENQLIVVVEFELNWKPLAGNGLSSDEVHVRNREHYEILDGGFDVEQAAIFSPTKPRGNHTQHTKKAQSGRGQATKHYV